MKTKKTMLFLVLFLASSTIVCSQNFWLDRSFTQEEQVKMDSMTNLSKAEMKEDIEFLCRVINEVNPQIKAMSTVMGVDIRDEINKLRLKSDSITSFAEFHMLAKKILSLCNEGHCNFESYYAKEFDNGNKNPYITEEGLDFTKYCSFKYKKNTGVRIADIRYIDGKYFIPYMHYSIQSGKISFNSKKGAELLLPAGAQIIEVDNIPIDEYISKYYGLIPAWDFKKEKKIAYNIISPYYLGLRDSVYRGQFNIKYKYQDKTEITTMDRPNTGSLMYRQGIISRTSNVFWFNETKTLYVRIPYMDYDVISKYKKEINKYRDKDIDKVIIDIRRNRGGNDMLWMELLSFIIKKPISYKMLLQTPNTPLVRDYLKTIRKDTLENYKSIKSPKFLYSDSALVEDKLYVLSPSANSLNYDGNIYVVYDEEGFSSSLGFIQVCTMSEQLISAGIPSNILSGRSTTPFYFSLPNSKLVFRMIPDLDATGAKTEKDLFDHSAELPISVGIEEQVRERKYKGERYAKKYLLNYDNTIKTILELEDSGKND